MPRQLNIQRVRDKMPVRYRVNPYLRFGSIAAHVLISGYCLLVLFTKVSAATPGFLKFLPLAVLFVSLDSLFRHLTSLNQVIFTQECLWFRYLLLPAVAIEYERITSLELRKVFTYYVYVGFTDRSGKKRTIKTQASFPRMIEIMYNIADLAPQVLMNDDLAKMVNAIKNLKERSETIET